MKIFIADDSEYLRISLIDMLGDIPGTEMVGQAATVNEAIDGILQTCPEVVILDIQMPGGTGIEVLKRVKTFPLQPVVIIFTNHPFPQYRKKCFEAGADYFFEKSTDQETLIDLIEHLSKTPIAEETALHIL